jgi:NADP-dependent 3-hydroxy acid dehydrogenase YdfG
MAAPLSEQIIVITGASSGIGRATAIAAGQQRASVALLARNEIALNDVAREIESTGGTALPLVTDVGDRAQVERAARMTLERFGRIDTWVNNAAVYAVAPVERLATDEIERVMQVNFMGVVYGTKAVLPHFIEREQGTLINVSSILGTRGAPWLAAYAASKHAIKGFTESLHVEMARDHPGISITLILPASINTPFFTHALARIGVKPRPFPPVYAPELVAEAILDSAERPKPNVVVGTGRGLAALEGIAPSLIDKAMLTADAGFRLQMSNLPDDNQNNLFAPMPPETYAMYGDWTDEMRRDSLGTRLFELHPNRARALVGAAALTLYAASRRRH